MRLNLYLRGIYLLDVEFHGGSKGLYLDVNWFKPRDDEERKPSEGEIATTGDLTSTPGGSFERAEPFGDPDLDVGGNGYGPIRPFGFQRSAQ